MKRLFFFALPLLALFAVVTHQTFASSADGPACHHGLDADRGKLAGVSDPTKKAQAYGHLKAAYQDELASNFTGCLDELKAAEALMQ